MLVFILFNIFFDFDVYNILEIIYIILSYRLNPNIDSYFILYYPWFSGLFALFIDIRSTNYINNSLHKANSIDFNYLLWYLSDIIKKIHGFE